MSIVKLSTTYFKWKMSNGLKATRSEAHGEKYNWIPIEIIGKAHSQV